MPSEPTTAPEALRQQRRRMTDLRAAIAELRSRAIAAMPERRVEWESIELCEEMAR